MLSPPIQSLFATSPRDTAIDALHAATAIYTAIPVVNSLLARIHWPSGDRILFDSSAGDGSFLDSALRRLLAVDPAVTPDRIGTLIEGWEIHPVAAAEARNRLADTLSGHGWDHSTARETAGRIVVNADFLTEHRSARQYDVIAGNPPYLRYVNVPDLLRKEYESVVPDFARNDLLHSFLNRCVEMLKPDGELAMVTADRWLFNMGAASLRSSLGRYVGISHIERLDPSTTFYRPKLRKAGTPPRVHPVAIVMKQGQGNISLGRDAIYPDALGQQHTAMRTLADIARVRICPWLGKEGIFVVSAAEAADLPPEYLVPAVDTDDIRNGIVQTGRRFAIRTVPGEEPPPEVARHLKRSLHKLPVTGRRHRDWWLPPEPWHNVSLEKESFLIPRIATGLRVYHLPPGVLAINHNMTVVASGVNGNEVERLLKSKEADRWICSRAPRLENGFYSITTSLLRQLPVHEDEA